MKLFRDIPPDFAWRLRAYQFAISCLPRAGHAFVQTRSRIRVLVRTCKTQRPGVLETSTTRRLEKARVTSVSHLSTGEKEKRRRKFIVLTRHLELITSRAGIYPPLNIASVRDCTRYVTIFVCENGVDSRTARVYVETHAKKFVLHFK